ncbi:hypothetical protein HY990_00065 [Candidatus Micrarchaeota archaeon]|nr:hypothetical protein [Candidatus Micrarchaeota archaeon]
MKYVKMLILLLLILLPSMVKAEAEEYMAISLERLQRAGLKSTSIPINLVIGIIIDDSGDIIIIGQRGNSDVITIDDIVLTFKGASMSFQPPGVNTIEDYSPGSSRTRVVFSGGIKNTSVGKYMTESIEKLYLLAEGKTKTPSGFWRYPEVQRLKFSFYPDNEGCFKGRSSRVFIHSLSMLGITLMPEKGLINDVDIKARDWVDQVLERYTELENKYSVFRRQRNFLRLITLFYFVKDEIRKDMWKQFLKEHQIGSVYTPDLLDFKYSRNIVGGVSCLIKEEKKGCAVNEKLDELQKIVIGLKKSDPNKWFFSFSFPLKKALSQDDKILELVEKLKEAGLYDKSLFLQIDMNRFPSVLKIFSKDNYYTHHTTAARQLRGLIRQTEKEIEGFNLSWKKLHEEYISPYLNKLNSKDPFLVFVSNDVTPEWVNLERVEFLTEKFNVIVVPQENGDFFNTTAVFLDRFERIPLIDGKKIGVVVSTQNEHLIQKLSDLKSIIGEERVLINPTKYELRMYLKKTTIEALLIDVEMGDEVMMLRDGSMSYNEILSLNRVDHIRYLAMGVFGINGLKSWDRTILKVLQSKGVGIIGISRQKASNEEIQARIERFEDVLEDEGYRYQSVLVLSRIISNEKIIFMDRIP